ncbi:hypothetical protein NQ176_g8658 [Zarea fungicola]|uniref:Uncharacterized protein n=1 Tax=Zarea fungicola TaxID=93591 RepID=A0ACC1MQZ8_9HYPO|nr:hypothetical protein NQ176_g8658 [Lecanicillium fungicola]
MSVPRIAPVVIPAAKDDDIPVIPPIKPLSYEEADAKIREGAASFTFNIGERRHGRVDVVSLGTKSPSEDHWDVGVVQGPDGLDTLYVGLYDGHKCVFPPN